MLGPGSPHGDSHQFLSSAPLLNNLAVTFPPSSFIFPINFFFSYWQLARETMSLPLGRRGRTGLGVSWSPPLFGRSPLSSALLSAGEGARLRLQRVGPRRAKELGRLGYPLAQAPGSARLAGF